MENKNYAHLVRLQELSEQERELRVGKAVVVTHRNSAIAHQRGVLLSKFNGRRPDLWLVQLETAVPNSNGTTTRVHCISAGTIWLMHEVKREKV